MTIAGKTNNRRLPRRVSQLHAGLVLYGVSMALLVESGLGLDPWDVFHQGVAEVTGLSFGLVVILTGIPILLLWIPLRQRPGFGTVANVIVIGLAVDAALAVLPAARPIALQATFMVTGIVLNGVATGLYIGARLGPGPRDGLMTGLVARFPRLSIRLVRTAIEVSVLVIGWSLGGQVGLGTVAYALTIGPLAQIFIRVFTVPAASIVDATADAPAGPRRVTGHPTGTGPAAGPAAGPAPLRSPC